MSAQPPPASNVRLENVFVTPEMAAEWDKLARSAERPIKAAKLNGYVTDMLDGNWYDNGQTIGFGSDGLRHNGNHRVKAVLRAHEINPDFPGAWMGVAWNADDRGIDVGANRTYGDHLVIEGKVGSRNLSKNLATVTRFAYMWDGGARSQGGSRVAVPTHTQLDTYQAGYHDLLFLAAERGLVLYSRSDQLISAGTFGMAYFLIARKYDVSSAEDFLFSVAIGADLPQFSAAFQLRKTMTKARIKRLDQSETLAYVLMAWRSHRSHRNVGRLQLPKGGLTQENYPKV